VSRNIVVVELRPFTIGIMFDADSTPRADFTRPVVHAGPDSHRLLGNIHLCPANSISLPGCHFRLLELKLPAARITACAPPVSTSPICTNGGAHSVAGAGPIHFHMAPIDLRCSHVFYICLAPWCSVTVAHQSACNMFPMDLIGPTDSPWFSMALRSTGPAVRLIQQSRRRALCSVLIHYQSFAFAPSAPESRSSLT
jgi:hypothetical protein